MQMESSSPPLNFVVREPEGLSLLIGPPFQEDKAKVRLEKVPCTSAKFSNDGSRLLLTTQSGVEIYDCDVGTRIQSFDVPAITAAELSPRGTFLQTYRRPSGPKDKNVTLWRVSSGEILYQLSQRQLTRSNWPAFQFSENEAIACRMATNEVQFYDTEDFTKGIASRIRVQAIAGMQLATSPPKYVAAYVPESKGIPASVQIFDQQTVGQGQPVARRSFFKCSKVQLIWNNGSSGLLVLAQSDVDKTNQSYYGESRLHYLTTDGCHEGPVPLSKDGPVHDVQWSPSGTEFAVIYGFMPAKITLFDKKCKALFEFGQGPYNTLRWNPRGKILCLAGFGNLPGDMAFWDCSTKRLLGGTRAECSVTSEWSPDGLYFMTATTAPRLQIDNGYKVFTYNGTLYFSKMFDKLYQAEWRPSESSTYGELPDLVEQMNQTLQIGTAPAVTKSSGTSSKSQTSTKVGAYQPPNGKSAAAPAAKPAAYQPPHSRNAAAIQAQLFGETSPSQEMSKTALRNKKKRERAKEKKAAEEAVGNTS